MIETLFIIISLFLGYFIDIKFIGNKHINKILNYGILIIIIIMGYKFGLMIPVLGSQMLGMANTTIIFICSLFFANIISIKVFFTLSPKHKSTIKTSSEPKDNYLFVLKSLSYLLYLSIGIAAGVIIDVHFNFLSLTVSIILFSILFFVGMQMRREGLNFKQILKNRTGQIIAIIVMISSLLVGVIISLIIGLPVKVGLMLTSGFGWYSLSSVINSQLLSPHYGVMTFFIDFSREIIAIILIPIVRKSLNFGMIGYAGSTSMDFSMPVIKENYGVTAVPAALCSGFILTLLTPILLSIFNLIN